MDHSRSRYTTTKNDLARQIAQDCGISIKIAEQAIDSLIDGIKRSVAAGNRVEFRKFGVFNQKRVKARTVTHYKRGQFQVPAAVRFSFKTAPELRSINADR